MTMARDWLRTLWPASYNGVPFQVDSDSEKGGRRKAVHQFAGRDAPFIEDLGEDKREFSVTAYVASDAADDDAAALMEGFCGSTSKGTLVLPAHGPVEVQCLTCKRERKGDKHGYIAFEMEFVRDGEAQPQPSTLSLANLVFVAADDLQAEISAFCETAIIATLQPDYVVLSAVDAVRDVAALLESIRTTAPVDPAVSALQRIAIQALHDDAPLLIHRLTGVDASLGTRLAALARALGDGLAPPAARGAFLPMVAALPDVPVDLAGTGSAQQAERNVNALRTAGRLAALLVIAEALARDKTISDRPAGISLRADVSELFEAEISPLDSGALAVAAQATQGAAVEYLSRLILDLAPVISAQSNVALPATVWAWRLYADPARAGELVARNGVAHPSFMPLLIEALAA